jgi:hypothetical protein
MPVFVAKDYEGYVVDIVLTKSKELAVIYWQGKKITPHTIRSFKDSDLEGHPTGLLPIMSSVTRDHYINGKMRSIHEVSKR